MTLRSLVLATLLLAGAAAPARAGGTVLYTNLVQAPTGGSIICNVVHSGKKRADLSVAILDFTGASVTSTSCPDSGQGGLCSISSPGGLLGYCKLSSTARSKDTHGAVLVTDSGGSPLLNVEAR